MKVLEKNFQWYLYVDHTRLESSFSQSKASSQQDMNSPFTVSGLGSWRMAWCRLGGIWNQTCHCIGEALKITRSRRSREGPRVQQIRRIQKVYSPRPLQGLISVHLLIPVGVGCHTPTDGSGTCPGVLFLPELLGHSGTCTLKLFQRGLI